MSLTRDQGGLSNPVPTPWVITVIVIVMIAWPVFGTAIGSYADAYTVVALMGIACGQRRRRAAGLGGAQSGPPGRGHHDGQRLSFRLIQLRSARFATVRI